MPVKNKDLHGNVPDKSPVALLLIDVINDLEFENNQSLLKQQALKLMERVLEADIRPASKLSLPSLKKNPRKRC